MFPENKNPLIRYQILDFGVLYNGKNFNHDCKTPNQNEGSSAFFIQQ
jgi:hypothetical protein